MSLKRKAFIGAIWSLVDKVFNQLGFFILLIYLARILGPSEIGIVAILAVFLMISDTLVNAGFSQALIQRSYDASEKDFSTVFFINLSFALLIYAILFLSAPFISDFYDEPKLLNASRILFLVVIIQAIAIVPKSRLTIAVNFKQQTIANAVSIGGSSVVAVYMAQAGFGYWSLVGMYITKSTLLTTTFLIQTRWKPQLLFSRKSFDTLFFFGSKLMIAGILATITNNLYALLIGKFYDTERVGYFTQGHNYTNMLAKLITSVIQGVTYPVMTSIQKDRKRLIDVYERVMGITMFFSIPYLVGFAAVAEDFVRIFLSEEWLPMVPVIIFLSLARLITPISSLNLSILNAIGRSDLFLRVDLLKLPIILSALFLTLPYGITVIAAGQLITTFIAFFVNAYYPGMLFGYGAWSQLKTAFPMLFSASIMWGTLSFFSVDNSLLLLAAKITFGAIIYLGLCFFFRVPYFKEIHLLIRKK